MEKQIICEVQKNHLTYVNQWKWNFFKIQEEYSVLHGIQWMWRWTEEDTHPQDILFQDASERREWPKEEADREEEKHGHRKQEMQRRREARETNP